MEDSKKKPIMIGVIVVCIGLAVAITVKTQSGGESSGLKTVALNQPIWLLCTNEDCKNTWQMEKRDFFEYLQTHQDPMSMAAPLVLCPSCSKESGVRAEKCAKCGKIFARSSVPHDFADRCPDCGYSDLEAKRKAAREAESSGGGEAEE
jgi:DNA-directed RNA polymerase subunit RPC12/RpoP